MEALAELIPLLLVAGYYILAARRRAAKRREMQERAQEVPEVVSEPRGATPFQQFMEQLEEAMAEAAGEPTPESDAPEPVPAPPAPKLPPRPAPPVKPREFRPVSGSFDDANPTDHEAHGFGFENPISEEAFEHRPAFGPRPKVRPADFDPHGLRAKTPTPTNNRRLGDLRRRLKTAEAAREAFVLQTIFGPRGGRKSENR